METYLYFVFAILYLAGVVSGLALGNFILCKRMDGLLYFLKELTKKINKS